MVFFCCLFFVACLFVVVVLSLEKKIVCTCLKYKQSSYFEGLIWWFHVVLTQRFKTE